ncbi:MAG: hypothetical protein J6X66_13650 [Lachnospiraceae bacterium]|nr:hypothetical protein [Lachnospiraceae bacterium]
MKLTKLTTAALLSAALICGCTSNEGADRGTIGKTDELTPTLKPTAEPTQAPTPTEAPVIPDIDLYGIMSKWDFEFSSGAGGWGTSLTVTPNGQFKGIYSDSEMGSTGPGYTNGTIYKCSFSGRFTDFEKVDDYTYNVTIGELEYENTPGTNEIVDKILYEYAEPYGLENTTELTVFLPGCPFKNLPDGFVEWVDYSNFGASANGQYYRDHPEFLYFCGLYNPAEKYGFYSRGKGGENLQYLINTAQLPGLKNVEANIENDNTYYYVDEGDAGLIHIENCCFKADAGADIYWKEEDFVDMCLNRTGHHPNKDSLLILGKDDDKYSDYSKYTYINGNRSTLTFWTQGSNEDTAYYLGVFSQIPGPYNSAANTSDPGYAYAYIIYFHPDFSPYTITALQCYLSSLDFSGTPDRLSSASPDSLDEYASSYAYVTAGKDSVQIQADLVEVIAPEDSDKIEAYGLTAEDFEDMGWATAGFDQDYLSYSVKENCPIYVNISDTPFDTLISRDELYERLSADPDGGFMYLYFDKDGKVVFIHEVLY